MEPIELLKCIKYINPKAHCVIWEGNKIVWDEAHKGKKPTISQCELVLDEMRAAEPVPTATGESKNLFSSMTLEEAEAWIDANVKTIPQSRIALKEIIKLVLAMK